MKRLMTWFFAVAVVCSALGAEQQIGVMITRPAPGEPAFGVVDFSVDAYPGEEVARVELFVDGRLVGAAEAPPYETRIDLGTDNREHRFEARAYDRSGGKVESLLVSPAITVDDVVDAELQQLYVTVTRGAERALDLGRDDFAVIDNGTREQLVTFSQGEVPLAAAVLVDASASMLGNRLRYALRGAAVFVAGLDPTDEASLVLFSDRLLHATPFANDPAVLMAGLTQVEADGGTALNDHLYLALKQLEKRQGRRVVIFLSDGVDSHSVLRTHELTWLARRSRALLYWIRTDPRNEERTSRFSAWKNADEYRAEIRQLAETVTETGGKIFPIAEIADAEAAFREILAELREQYVLGYYPTIARNDGSWHTVTVRLRNSSLDVRTREGYIDY